MCESAALEERRRVDIADGEVMAHVEIGTCAIVGQIVGINENICCSVRGIINGVAPGIGQAQGQISDSALQPDLQGMIDGIGAVPESANVVESRECRAYRRIVGDEPASNVQV